MPNFHSVYSSVKGIFLPLFVEISTYLQYKLISRKYTTDLFCADGDKTENDSV